MNKMKQSGMSMLGMLVTVLIIAGLGLLSIKIIPLYIDDYAIANALNSLQDEEIFDESKMQIRNRLRTKLSADYTRDLEDEEIQITREKGLLTIEIDYEARVPVIYNLDVVAHFNHRLEKR